MQSVETDGHVYLVEGEDGKTYGCFLVKDKADRFKERLNKEFGAYFSVLSYTIGPSAFFRHLAD